MLKVLSASSSAGRAALEAVLASRSAPDFDALTRALPLVRSVLSGGERALARLVARHDGGVAPEGLRVDPAAGPSPEVSPAFAAAFRLAASRIAAYHRRQRPRGFTATDREGVAFTETPVPHDAIGVYVPGGRAFYPSSLMMGVVPARVAGVPRIVVATPPRAWASSPELRWAARELGVAEVLLAGGAHGIAGLVRVSRCTKIVGPGNRWVAAAKHLVSSLVSVDLPAGPSEVLIVASAGAEPGRIAADLLAQAEHDPLAVCLLFTESAPLARAVRAEVSAQLRTLPTAPVARESLAAKGLALVFRSIDGAVAAAREVAVEHVQVMGDEAESRAAALAGTSGALFVGEWAPTAFGDYLAGPNHVLPTGGAARSFSGLSVRDFYRWSRTVSLPEPAARRLAGPAAVLARFEGLEGHARSLDRRAW